MTFLHKYMVEEKNNLSSNVSPIFARVKVICKCQNDKPWTNYNIYVHRLHFPPKLMVSTCRINCLSACRQWTFFLPLFWDIATIQQTYHYFLKYCKDISNLLFWVFWACPPKRIAETCTKLWRLPAKNSTWFINFLRILHFKESWNLIDQKQFGK